MLSNRLAFLLLGAACISAAAGGGYLATRQNAVPAPVQARAVSEESPAAPALPERPAVQETEAVVGDRAPVAVAEAPPPAPARTTSARRRSPDPAPAPRESRPASRSARAEPAPTLQSTWPSSAERPASAAAAPSPEPLATRTDDRLPAEPIRAPEPRRPTFEELVVSRDSVIGLETEKRLSSETARVEDRVEARVTRDVRVGDRIAIPSGARVIGTVTQVERGGKFKEQARLGIRFHTIVLGDGERLPISTETIVRVGETPNSASKIGGGAVGGAILGAILGGAKGAAIGATAGAGAGTAVVQAGDRSEVVLAPGTPLTARILSPVTVTVERN